MKSITYILVTITVISLAFWAYQESYRAKSTLNLIRTVNKDIHFIQEKLGVLRVEWAYLNRPDRLRALADLNFEKLRLIELNTKHFDDLMIIGVKNQNLSSKTADVLNQTNFNSDAAEISQ